MASQSALVNQLGSRSNICVSSSLMSWLGLSFWYVLILQRRRSLVFCALQSMLWVFSLSLQHSQLDNLLLRYHHRRSCTLGHTHPWVQVDPLVYIGYLSVSFFVGFTCVLILYDLIFLWIFSVVSFTYGILTDVIVVTEAPWGAVSQPSLGCLGCSTELFLLWSIKTYRQADNPSHDIKLEDMQILDRPQLVCQGSQGGHLHEGP